MRDDTAQPREERGAAIHMIGLSAAFADAPLHAPAALSSSEAPSLPVDGSAMWQTDGADLALSFDAKADAAPDLPRAPSEIGTETSDAMPTQPVEAVVWAEDAQAVAVSDVELNADAIGGRSPDESDMVEGANGPAQTVADPSPEPAEEASEAAAPSMQDGAMDMVETNASSPSNALTFPDGETELTLSELEAALGRPLDADDILVVPMGATLIIDGDVELGGLIVQGTATVADMADIAMSSDWVLVMGGGQFEVGTEANPHAHDFTLTLTGDDPDQDLDISGMLMAAGVPMMEGMGNMTIENQDSFLMVMGEGSALNLHSADAEKTSWTQLDGTAEAGATSITLAEATGWQIGDVIAIASTDFNPDQAEELTVTAVSSDGKTISFMPPLDFMHYGEVDRYNDPDGDVHQLDMRAEVSLLSRNIKIQGDVDYDDGKALNQQDDGYGGHTMVMNGGEMYVSGVEFAYMGQAGILGKYPVHWHESGDVSGQYITNSSIHHSFNKGITVHNTQGAEVRGNVVFETISHNYYMEQNETAGNYLIDNLGINARHVGRFDEIRGASDNTPANFYTTNAENTWIGNHGAGSEHYGFYFDLSRDERYGFGTVENNSVHSIDSRAFYVHHGGMAQDGSPQGDPEQPQKAADWVVTGLTVYKSGLGVYSQAANGTFTDSVFAEMGSNGRFRLNTTIEDSLIIGRSDNIGNPETNDELDAGRSLPGGDGDFQGWQLYDGPGSLSNVMFEGFTEDDDAIQTSNAIHKTASFGLEGITWGENVADAAKFSIGGGGNAYGVDAAARGLVDIDGSISGVEGAMIYQLSSDGSASEGFNAGAAYEINRDWGTIITTSGEQSATLTVDRGGTPETNTGKNHGLPFDSLGATRSDGEYANDIRQQVPLFDGYTYDLAFRDADQDNFRLYLGDADWGQSFIVSLGDEIPATSSFTIHNPNTGASRPAREVSSMEMLEASPDTAVFRDADGVVHVKLVGEMAHGYLWPQPGAAPDGFLNSGVTVLVDMEADLDLGALVFNDPQPGDALGPPPYAEGQDPTDPPEDPPAEDPPAEDPPEDPPAEDPPSDAETVTAFVEENGWVMIEAESYEDLPEGWVKKG
ncbi:MAG: G8 domain-containing protein, partial [Pseudomonadota bacterium]